MRELGSGLSRNQWSNLMSGYFVLRFLQCLHTGVGATDLRFRYLWTNDFSVDIVGWLCVLDFEGISNNISMVICYIIYVLVKNIWFNFHWSTLKLRCKIKHILVYYLICQRVLRIRPLEEIHLRLHTNQLHKIKRILRPVDFVVS